jgi:4-hydroxy-3-polyprenylbenzoate decarboxylase
MKVVVGVTGASGVTVAKRLIEELKREKIETRVIVSDSARLVMKEEGVSIKSDYDERDIAADLSSSSNRIDAFVICPCSVKTLGGIAHGYTDNLIARLADNCLKMRRKLILCVRETPYSLVHIRNMELVTLAGAIVMPLNVAYYFKPKKIEDITDFFVGKIFDLLGMEHKLYRRWRG